MIYSWSGGSRAATRLPLTKQKGNMETRTCTKCNTEQPLDEEHFQPNPRYVKGFAKWCKLCHVEANRNWRRTQQVENSDFWKNNAMRKHHVDLEWYTSKLHSQKEHCALCEATLSNNGDRLGIDHNHKHCPGKYGCKICVRGLLCSVCNARLGYLEQILQEAQVKPQPGSWIERAMRYIDSYKHQENHIEH